MSTVFPMPTSVRARCAYRMLRTLGLSSEACVQGVGALEHVAPGARASVLRDLFAQLGRQLDVEGWLHALGFAPGCCELCGERVGKRETAAYHPGSQRLWCRNCAIGSMQRRQQAPQIGVP